MWNSYLNRTSTSLGRALTASAKYAFFQRNMRCG